LNQPLGSILTNTETAELLLNEQAPDLVAVREILVDIKRDDARASEVIRRLRSMLKKTPFEIKEVDLNETVREAIGFIAAIADRRGIVLKLTATPSELRVNGDPVQLQQVLLNLIINAMDAVSDADSKIREVSVATAYAKTYAEIRVGDTGPGIVGGNLKKVFDPFFTTKPQGMGMGLAIARTIIEAHHGQIFAENQVSGGAVFVIRLPIA
jgi:signal transduction histidine kinase